MRLCPTLSEWPPPPVPASVPRRSAARGVQPPPRCRGHGPASGGSASAVVRHATPACKEMADPGKRKRVAGLADDGAAGIFFGVNFSGISFFVLSIFSVFFFLFLFF